MSHILITGMTAAQASARANVRFTTFAGQIAAELYTAGHLVVWQDPSVHTTLDDLKHYDTVLVGLSPITGLPANRAYGALSLIGLLFDDPRLRFFIDAPNPRQITHSLNAILATPANLNKAFYSYRQEYVAACEPTTRLRIYTAIRRMATESWPLTAIPVLPWHRTDTAGGLPRGADTQIVGLNLDARELERQGPSAEHGVTSWVTDSPRSPWVLALEPLLEHAITPLKAYKFSDTVTTDRVMAMSIGVILPPGGGKRTWWSGRYAQAMRIGVPVVTEWQESQYLGGSWAYLVSQIEAMSDARRFALAEEQKASYLASIGTGDQQRDKLLAFLDI